MKFLRAFLKLSRASADKINEKAKMIMIKMLNNPVFATPNPSLDIVQAQIDIVSEKISRYLAIDTEFQQIVKELNKEGETLKFYLDNLGNYVETVASGDASIILAAGYEVKHASVPIGKLDPPINVLAHEGSSTGEIVCSWKSVKGAKSYSVEMSNDINNPNGWKLALIITKTKCSLGQLVSGTRIWLRVAAIGAAGQGGFSDVTTRIVP